LPVALKVERGPHRALPRAEILRRARVMCKALQLGETELSIVLTGDPQIQKLNAEFRHKDAPTDVLAFAMREGEGGHLQEGILGDVVVSVDTARIQAARVGRDVMSEVTMLLAHGVLHLLGWDHDTRAKDVRMRAETARLCTLAEKNVKARRAPRRRVSVGR
jgi:probable rRNA maturation factor